MKTRTCLLALLVPLLVGAPPCTADDAGSTQAKLDVSAVMQLLDVLDLLVRKNPGYKATVANLNTLPRDVAHRELQLRVDKNAADLEIQSAIQQLLDSPTYRLYYKQFRNVTPEIHRKMLCALPYTAIDGPAGIALNWQELTMELDSVRAWASGVLTRVDLKRSQEVAARWLPPGEYSPPLIHFFYDGNGDAFALDGEVGMDLYGTVFARRAPHVRFRDLSDFGVERVELILAHELNHVYAERYLYPPGRKYADWREKWKDRLVRQIVSEGVAMQCDVGPGFRRTVMEDTGVVRFWIGELNARLAAFRDQTVTESEIERWFANSFHAAAVTLLNEYRKRTTPTGDSASFMRLHQIDRPSMIYTLGWWMVGRISEGGRNRDRVIALLSDPTALFETYNKSLAPVNATLRVDF